MRYPVPRLAYLALGLIAAGLAIYLISSRGASVLPLIVFAIAPDLALLLGAAPGLARGQIHPRAVPLYNAVHRLWVPLVLIVVALVILRSPSWVVAGLAWLAHIAFDRSSGFGLRSREGFQRSEATRPPSGAQLME